jgi:ATP-dependent protease HslVU (ClpYQ) peptidase subunit
MTTIAYRDGVLAADTRVTRGGYIMPGHFCKIGRSPSGDLVGISGNCAKADGFLRAVINGTADPTAPEEGVTALVISPDGRITVHEAAGRFDITGAEFWAIGSGTSAALGALHAGASAEEAVRIAMLIDNDSGGEVNSLRLAANVVPFPQEGSGRGLHAMSADQADFPAAETPASTARAP